METLKIGDSVKFIGRCEWCGSVFLARRKELTCEWKNGKEFFQKDCGACKEWIQLHRVCSEEATKILIEEKLNLNESFDCDGDIDELRKIVDSF